MRQVYVVTYDVCDPKRLRRVFRVLRGYGEHLQYSVFRCELNDRERIELRAKLHAEIHHGEDQVLFVDVGPADGRAGRAFETLGLPYVVQDEVALVF